MSVRDRERKLKAQMNKDRELLSEASLELAMVDEIVKGCIRLCDEWESDKFTTRIISSRGVITEIRKRLKGIV